MDCQTSSQLRAVKFLIGLAWAADNGAAGLLFLAVLSSETVTIQRTFAWSTSTATASPTWSILRLIRPNIGSTTAERRLRAQARCSPQPSHLRLPWLLTY